MNTKPVFIHSLFRSGSTYLFDVFRRSDKGYWCYQEPLNEHLLDRSEDAFWLNSQQQDSMADYLRHPKLNKPYFFEFAEIKEVVLSRFRPEFCYELFFLAPGQQADELSQYIAELVTHARGRAVLQCCRSIGRMKWARSKSDGVHIFLWRNPWDQWWSYKIDPYFDLTSCAVYGAKGLPDFLSRVRDESGLDLPSFQKHLPDWGKLQKEIALHADHAKSYLLFYALWVYGLLESRITADVSMNIDMLSESLEYRNEVLARLSDLGITGLNFSDADAHRSIFGKNDLLFFSEIENKVHELLLKSGYDKTNLDWLLAERENHSPSRQKQQYERTPLAEVKLLSEDIFRLRKMLQRYGTEFQEKKNFSLALEAMAQTAEGKLTQSHERVEALEGELADSRGQSDILREALATAQLYATHLEGEFGQARERFQATVQSQQQTMVQKEEQVHQLQATVERQEQTLHQQHEALVQIFDSLAWQLIVAWRRVKDSILPLRSRRRREWDLIIKGIKTIKKQGLRVALKKAHRTLKNRSAILARRQAPHRIGVATSVQATVIKNHRKDNFLFSALPFGVNVAGFVSTESGIGEGVRANIRALKAAGIPCVINKLESDLRGADNTFTEFSLDNPYIVNLIHINADHGIGPFGLLGEKYLKNHYNIAFWYWELNRFREEWLPSFKPYHEIWVASDFCLSSISAASPIPVVKIPPSLVPGDSNMCDRSKLAFTPEDFIFLYMFDVSSYFERKNPIGLVHAFKQAFRHDDRALLVLKFTNSSHDSSKVKLLEREAEGYRIRLIDSCMSKKDLNALINMSDCYVSLHRSEGFGFTLAESMYFKKPVMATAYGGNMEFMNVNNSFLVPCQEIEIDQTYGPYCQGWKWADPNIDAAADLMRYIYENPDKAQSVAERGAADIRSQLNPLATGRLMADRLNLIMGPKNGGRS